MKQLISMTLALSVFVFTQGVATAQNLLLNGGFEDPSGTVVGTPSLLVGDTSIPSWTVVNQETAWIFSGNFGIFPSEGLRSLDLSGYHDSAPFGGVTQTIPTQVNALYRLSFDLGAFSGSSVRVNAGTTTADFVHTLFGIQHWQTFSFDFTASSTSTAITLTGLSSAANNYIGLDNASVTFLSASSAPEPGSVVLFTVGGLIWLVRRRRS